MTFDVVYMSVFPGGYYVAADVLHVQPRIFHFCEEGGRRRAIRETS